MPDLPGILEHVLADLKGKESRGFGEFNIHRSLTKLQLEKILTGKADLIENENYVHSYLSKLLPGADDNIASSSAVREAYLERAWKFVKSLSPSFTSLKAHLLYQRLSHDHAIGQENEKRFLSYLALPRNVSYLNPEWRKNKEVSWGNAADLGRDFRQVTNLRSARGGDEKLVKEYLLLFLKNAKDSKKFSPYLRESWLRSVFAESKIMHGIGKPANWASLLSPSQFQELKDRVDIEFDATSQEVYRLEDEVSFKVHLKNVPNLIVKVFEINTLNYYRNLQNEVSTDIDLDGLIANHVEVHEYQDAPQLRLLREFKIPSIEKRRGLWVVEFIGGGKSSRAVIRKGSLGILNRSSSKGELLTVLDEEHQPLKGAGVWLGNRKYSCDDLGRTILPFSNNPGLRSIVIEDAHGFATLGSVNQPAESYTLDAGMHLEQEALRTGGKAKIIVRPTFSVADRTISLKDILSTTLELSSTNLDGLPASTSFPDFKLFSDRESIHEFRVPDRVTQLTATLRIKVKVASRGGEEIELSDSRTFKVNSFLSSERVGDLYLSKIDGSYRVEFLGRNGEPLDGQNLNATFHRHGFKNSRSITFKTDEVGGIDLGQLAGIREIGIGEPSGQRRSWVIHQDRRDQIGTHTLVQGQEFKVPFIGDLTREKVALFSKSAGGIVSDEFTRLKLSKGYLIAANLPAGDYRLFLKSSGQSLQILVARGTVSKGYVFNESRMLELSARQPSHLEQLKIEKDRLKIKVSGLDALTRVHVIATRFLPGEDLFHSLRGSQRSGLLTGRRRYLPSLYISGRNLGDELRYILERRYADKFPGNMLTRPEILLNPWAIRDTESDDETLAGGDEFERKPTPAAAPSAMSRRRIKEKAAKRALVTEPAYEFLSNDPVIVTNLVPEKNGRLSVNLDAFGDRQHIHVLLVDPDGTTYRSVSLPDRETALRDLRLLKSLDEKRHFTEQENVSILKKGESLKLHDLVNAKFEIFDSLSSVHRYFLNLNDDETLREFAFITRWPSLSDEEKNAKYSKYASHELSFFLSRKDPAFFKSVILPHLANKKDRTFMDDYLLGQPLAKYMAAFDYARLNVVERLLLAKSDPKRLAALALDLEHRLAVQSPDLGRAQYFFDAAISGGAFGDGYAGELLAESAEMSNEADAFMVPPADEMRALGVVPGKANSLYRLEAKKSEKNRQSGALAELQDKVREVEMEEMEVDSFGAMADGILPPEQVYRSLEPTKEWAENNYYRVRITDHSCDLIDENRFWLDLANQGLQPGFGSRHLGEATGNFAEMMLALAFLDLPFESPEHSDEIEKGDLNFTAGGSLLFFHREIEEAGMAAKRPPLLVSQSYFQWDDRFRMEDGEKVDRFITEEFVRGVVYGAQVVVTNPTSSRQQLDILTQLPKGAIPVMGQRTTANQQVTLNPYSTHRLELAFYFPFSGEFPVFPAHLAKAGEVVGYADSLIFKVVDEPSSLDQTSWSWISQWAEEEAVLKYLETANLHALDLSKVAWRCRESADFFKKVSIILDQRGIYERTLQSYALLHDDKVGIGQYLLMQRGFLNQCGLALSSDLVTLDPIDRRSFEHLEYKPLINKRAHALGGGNRILNPVIRSQYQSYLTVLSQQKELDHMDHLGVTYYLFLQDRVSEALAHLNRVDAAKLATQIQYDYFQAYAAFYEADLGKARQITKKYEKYPVDRWRKRFLEISQQIAEIAGDAPVVVEEGNRKQEQQAAAAREPSLEVEITAAKATLTYQNVEEVIVNYYEMDLEFLFSTNPFVSSGTSRFSIIKPNQSVTMRLAKGSSTKVFDLPEKYRATNVIVEILGAGKSAAKAVYTNDLRASLSERMGILSVRHGKTGKALPKVYVKVYADTLEGVKFFKDGYTDLRGKFDYASVSTTGLGSVSRFSILVMSEDQGATVLEAKVPLR